VEVLLDAENPTIVVQVSQEAGSKLYTITFDTGDPIISVNGATASSFYQGNATSRDQAPENVINNSGMSGTNSLQDTHAANANGMTMWHTDANDVSTDGTAWIQFDLGAVYALDEMWIWNMNQN